MTYRVKKIIRGRAYWYDQRSFRENGKVRTECRYVGPVDGASGDGLLRRRMRRKTPSYEADLEKAMRQVARLTGRSVEQQLAEIEAEFASHNGIIPTITVPSTFATPTAEVSSAVATSAGAVSSDGAATSATDGGTSGSGADPGTGDDGGGGGDGAE